MCLNENGVCDFCLTTVNALLIETDTQFIWHHQRRDENLTRTLQCVISIMVIFFTLVVPDIIPQLSCLLCYSGES